MKHVLLQKAYVLHTRYYRETSLLVELFTPEYGRLTLVAKGVRKTSLAGLLQPFVPLLVSWTGQSELKTLSYAESAGRAQHLHGECLFAGLYLNELLIYLLQKWDAHVGLFNAYEHTLSALQTEALEQKTLRSFEKYLLEELGYGFLPKSNLSLQKTFSPDKYYQFVPDEGFVLTQHPTSQGLTFSGKNLLAIAREDWQDDAILQDAKRLIRFVLAPLLGNKTIYSRRFFR